MAKSPLTTHHTLLTRLHVVHHLLGDELGRRLPRDHGRRDDHVDLPALLVEQPHLRR